MDGSVILEGVFFVALAFAAWKSGSSGPAYAMAVFDGIATAATAINSGFGKTVLLGMATTCAFAALGRYQDHVAIQGYVRKYAAEKEADR